MLIGVMNQAEVARHYHIAKNISSSLLLCHNITGTAVDRLKTGPGLITSRRRDVHIRQRHSQERFQIGTYTFNSVIRICGRTMNRAKVMNRLLNHRNNCYWKRKGLISTCRSRAFTSLQTSPYLDMQQYKATQIVR